MVSFEQEDLLWTGEKETEYFRCCFCFEIDEKVLISCELAEQKVIKHFREFFKNLENNKESDSLF